MFKRAIQTTLSGIPESRTAVQFRRARWLTFKICLLLISGCDYSVPEPSTSNLDKVTDSIIEEQPETSRQSEIAREFLDIAQRLKESENPFLGRRQLARLREARVSISLPSDMLRNHVDLSRHLLRLGEVDEAVKEIDDAYALRDRLPPGFSLQQVQFDRAFTYLRLAEVENCIKQHNCDCCIFPLRGGGVHVERGPAGESRQMLLDILAVQPNNLTAIWLLNIITMALGEYPESVPPDFRIPESAFDSDYDIGRFRDRASDLGVDTFNLAGGVIVEDFNGDQLLDIVTSTYDPEGPLTYYVNDGDGTFSNRTAASGLDEQLGGLNAIGADYDGDGDTDILVLRGAWLYDDGQIRNSLLQNNGGGKFEDVTRRAGLAEPAFPTQAAVWGDFNNDGHLDLYIGNESRLEMQAGGGSFPSQLFMNQGDGTFVDRADAAGVTNDRYAKGVTAGDYDNDGDLDLYVSNLGPNRMYQNQGDATFRDVAVQLNLTQPARRSFATWFFDFDNDGWLDLFVAAFEANVRHLAKYYLEGQNGAERPRLYRNQGDGTFMEIGEKAGLNFPCAPMGANFGDLDNDGFLDVYLTTGDPKYQTLMPNVMLRNDSGQSFQDVTTSGGFGHLQKGHGVAFADIDNDGDQDIYHQLGGFYPGDKFRNVLFENAGHGNHYVILRLVGTRSHRSGMGARVQVVVNDAQGQRAIHRAVGSVSSFGGSPIRQEIGLGPAAGIERIEIKWPNSEQLQLLESVDLDSDIEITEGSGYRSRKLKPMQF